MDDQTLEGLLRQYTTNSINQMFTSIPGRIIKVVDAGEQRVDVQPLVDRVKPDDSTLTHPVILGVPLIFPGSRYSQFSFPVEVGDTVLLVFSQRSIQRFKQGAESPHRPINLSKYSRNDACAIPGLFSFPSAVNNPSKRTLSHDTDDAVVSHNIGTAQECEVRLKASGDITITSPGKTTVNTYTAEVNASTATVNATTTINGDTTINGNLTVVGDGAFSSGVLTHNGQSVGDDHFHTQANDSNGDTEADTSTPVN